MADPPLIDEAFVLCAARVAGIDLVVAMNDENLSRFIAVARRYGLAPVMPVAIETLRNASLIDQWHRESTEGSTRCRGARKD